MPHRQGSSLANPMLGLYFGIFASGLAAVVVLLLIFEQMGFTNQALRTAMVLVTVGLFFVIGAGAYTGRPREFLLSGRRVPAFYNGLALTASTFGGSVLAGAAGALFLTGFDMLFLGLGLVAGLTVMVMLIAPFLRKFGAPTVPAYLGQRFESGPVRLVAASIAVVPLMLVVVAEIKVAMLASAWLTPLAPATAVLLIVLVLIATVAPGGARSQSWSGAAQGMAMVVAVLVPATITAVMETNLPFGQLSHGPLLRAVGRAEAIQSVPVPIAGWLSFEVPGEGLQTITSRFETTFGSVGPLAFVLGMLSVLAGVAGSPALLARSVMTPSVYETRKSIGWAVALVGVLLMTMSAIAVFERDFLISKLAGQTRANLPPAFLELVDLGLAAIDGRQAKLPATSFQFERNGMLVALPVLMGMPRVVVNLAAAGLLAAALAAAAASLAQLGIIVGEDVVNAPNSWQASDFVRLTTCRAAIAVTGMVAGGVALFASGDPLVLTLHALAITGSTLFPVLGLSIWWKRATAAGAMAGLVAGFAVALGVMLMAEVAYFGLPAALAPVLGIPAAIAATMVVSNLTPVPGRHILETVRDLRIPAGETIHDRELRLARQNNRRSG